MCGPELDSSGGEDAEQRGDGLDGGEAQGEAQLRARAAEQRRDDEQRDYGEVLEEEEVRVRLG